MRYCIYRPRLNRVERGDTERNTIVSEPWGEPHDAEMVFSDAPAQSTPQWNTLTRAGQVSWIPTGQQAREVKALEEHWPKDPAPT